MRKLFRFLKPYKLQIIAAPSTKFLEAAFELIMPLIMAYLIDVAIAERNAALVWQLSAAMAALAIVGLGCSLFCQYNASVVAANFGKDVRDELFKKVERMSERERERLGSAGLVNRWTADVYAVSHSIGMFIRLVLRAPFLCIGGIIMAIIMDAKLSLILAVFVPILVATMIFVMKKTIPRYKEASTKLDKMSVQAKESVGGAHIVRAFGQEKDEFERFAATDAAWRNAELRAVRTASLLSPSAAFIMNMSVVLILWFGGARVQIGYMSAGKLLAFLNYVSHISLSVVVVTNLSVVFMRAGVAAARINQAFEAMDEASGTTTQPNECANAVELKNVCFSYDDEPMLKNIDLKIKRFERVGIIGGTGGGKTTLVKIICGDYDCNDVFVLGESTNNWDKAALRELIAVAPQRPAIFSGTIKTNLLMGKMDASNEQIEQACVAADIWHFIENSPEHLEREIFEAGSNLSGGQKQRLSIARALLKQPQILILDDSLSALDTQTELRVRTAILSHRFVATIIVSQRVKSVKELDRIIVLNNGRIEAEGTHTELIGSCALYNEIAQSQNEAD